MPEQTYSKDLEELQINSLNLHDRNKLSPALERLLGQLAVVAFRNSEHSFLSLLNFPGRKQIQMAKLPEERKQGQERENKRLFNKRIESGRHWINHLPGSFNDKVISRMFLNIDEDVATNTVKEYYSTKIRLPAASSASLKSYASLNDKVYERFNRMSVSYTHLTLPTISSV